MDADWQLLPSQLDGVNWGPLNYAYHGPQLTPTNYYMLISTVDFSHTQQYIKAIFTVKAKEPPHAQSPCADMIVSTVGLSLTAD